MNASLMLDLPWLPPRAVEVEGVIVQQGSPSRLVYDDGISVGVRLVSVRADEAVESILERVGSENAPGQVELVVGNVPVGARPVLRAEGVSWFATDGRMELRWPRLSVGAHRLSLDRPTTHRHRDPVALQKHQALVAQHLCELELASELPMTISSIAESAGVSVSATSTAITNLARQGYVLKERRGNSVHVSVPEPGPLARLLADRTGWAHTTLLWAYGYGRSPLDVAHRLAGTASEAGVPCAVTGRVGATFLGVVGTGEVTVTRVRVQAAPDDAQAALLGIGLEPVERDAANVAVALDRWGLGTTHAAPAQFQGYSATVAPPLRVWCDVADEPRGIDFAAQLWEEIGRGR